MQKIETVLREFTTQLALLTKAMQRTRLALDQALLSTWGTARARQRMASAKRYRFPSPGRQLQGQYIGKLAGLEPNQRARVKSIAKRKGIAAAVEAANTILRR
jgi:hypothetical protein